MKFLRTLTIATALFAACASTWAAPGTPQVQVNAAYTVEHDATVALTVNNYDLALVPDDGRWCPQCPNQVCFEGTSSCSYHPPSVAANPRSNERQEAERLWV